MVSSSSRRTSRPWVIKLGGSLHDTPSLRRWLKKIAASPAPIVVVPGGGPFADAVRAAQRRLKFSDAVAHHMALLAMEQYGRAFAEMSPRLRLADSARSIRSGLQAGHKPVWLPAKMVIGRPDIDESWDVTSDSLALWLAGRLRARALLLVKSAPLPVGTASARNLSRRGIIDAAFPRMLAAIPCRSWCIAGRNHGQAARAFREGIDPQATRISLP